MFRFQKRSLLATTSCETNETDHDYLKILIFIAIVAVVIACYAWQSTGFPHSDSDQERAECIRRVSHTPYLTPLIASARPSVEQITLTTQTTLPRLSFLITMASTWNPGHIVATIYIPLQDSDLARIGGSTILNSPISLSDAAEENFKFEIEAVRETYCSEPSLRTHVDIHFVVQGLNYFDKPHYLYPYNNLRNIALSHVETDFIFIADVDLQPSSNFTSMIAADLLESLKTTKRALVVPFFTMRLVDDCGKRIDPLHTEFSPREVSEFAKAQLPPNKAALRKMLSTNKQMIRRALRDPQAPTSPITWLRCNESYNIDYWGGYEPFLIIARRHLLRFPEQIKGYAGDKQAFTLELAARGFQFTVPPNVFVIHLDHTAEQHHVDGTISQYRSIVYAVSQHVECRINDRYPLNPPEVELSFDKYQAQYEKYGELLPNSCAVGPVRRNPYLKNCKWLK